VAHQLGIDEAMAESLCQKLEKVRRTPGTGPQRRHGGDGINRCTAPPLASERRHRHGHPAPDVAIESAALRSSKETCAPISKAIGLSRATMRNVKQNLFFAFVYNALGVPIAAGVLYPSFGLLLSRSSPARDGAELGVGGEHALALAARAPLTMAGLSQLPARGMRLHRRALCRANEQKTQQSSGLRPQKTGSSCTRNRTGTRRWASVRLREAASRHVRWLQDQGTHHGESIAALKLRHG